jgi:hypothetical protein
MRHSESSGFAYVGKEKHVSNIESEADMKSSNPSRLTLVAVLGGPLCLGLPTEASESDPFHTLTPCQLVDTRCPGGPSGRPILQHDTIRKFPVQGVCALPGGAKADFFNLTAVRPTGARHITLCPSKITRPFVSSIDLAAEEMAVYKRTVVRLADQGTVLRIFPCTQRCWAWPLCTWSST